MTQEDKDLLFKDLSARLPYGVVCYWRIGSELTLNLTEYNGQLTGINKVEIEDSSDYYYDCYFNVCNDSNGNSFQNEDVPVEIVKPYLRPVSSMTKEEALDMYNLLGGHSKDKIRSVKIKSNGIEYTMDNYKTFFSFGVIYSIEHLDYLNSHHFDYRGLIEKGLSLEAPEGMYNIKEK